MAANYWTSSHYRYNLDVQQKNYSPQKDDNVIVSRFCSSFIIQLSQTLHLRRRVTSTACIYIKRYFVKESLGDSNPIVLAASCLFLACKIEESYINSKVVVDTLNQRNDSRELGIVRQEDIVKSELDILKALDCNLLVYHPYKSLLLLNKHLFGDLSPIREGSLKFLNDSYLSEVIIFHSPFVIALSCMYIAALKMKDKEKDDETGNQIHNIIHTILNLEIVDLDEIGQVSKEILTVYELNDHDLFQRVKSMVFGKKVKQKD